MRQQILGMESMLSVKENEVRQLQIAHSEAESMAIENISSGQRGNAVVKEEPFDEAV